MVFMRYYVISICYMSFFHKHYKGRKNLRKLNICVIGDFFFTGVKAKTHNVKSDLSV